MSDDNLYEGEERRSSWGEHQKLVLYRLRKLDEELGGLRREMQQELAGIREDIGKSRVEIAMLKVKSGLWGAAAGLIPAALVALISYLGGSGV